MNAPCSSDPSKEGNRMLVECLRAKLRFHAVGTESPWRAPLEKLSRRDLDSWLVSTPNEEIERELEFVCATITPDDLAAMEALARKSSSKLVLAVLALRYALVAMRQRENAPLPF
jgi:hypothetical protein